MTTYKLYTNSADVITIFSDEMDKEEMGIKAIYEWFVDKPFCIREKWVDGEMRYRNKFLLEERREDEEFINNWKRNGNGKRK